MALEAMKRGSDDVFGAVLACPNPTGELHMGHALNLTIQDVLCRWRRLRGAKIRWAGAIDHGATATEFVVRKMLREKNVDTSAWTNKDWEKAIGDWFNRITPRIYRQFHQLDLTMDVLQFRSMRDPVRLRQFDDRLGELNRAGLIYRGKAVVPWCAALRTTVDKADIVAESAPLNEHAVRYVPEQAGDAITLWVEHPETLVNDAALVVSPRHPLATAGGPQFVTSPIGLRLPVAVDDDIDPDGGTAGATRIVPGHCAKSFRWASRNGYTITRAYDDNNIMEAPDYGAKTRLEARRASLQAVMERGQHDGMRELRPTRQIFRLSGQPIEEFLTEQYFIKTAPLAEGALRLLKSGAVRVHPHTSHEMLEVYMEQIVGAKRHSLDSEFADDWCISQQTNWGAPLNPAVLGESDRSDLGMAAAGQIGSMKLSCAIWAFCANWVFANSREEYAKLARNNVMVTGVDLLTWWIAPIIMLASALDGGMPARDVIIHPIICDAAGRKMSKSLGNVVTPNDLIEEYGGDALRISLLSRLDLRRDGLAFDAESVGEAKALLDRLRRVLSAMPWIAAGEPLPAERNSVAKQAMSEIETAFADFDFEAAMKVVHRIIRRIIDCAESGADEANFCRSLLPLLEPFAPRLVRAIRELARPELSVLGA
jgi:valyl-tRNA synthetase